MGIQRSKLHPNVHHFLGIVILLQLSVGAVAVVESAASTTEVSLDRALEEYRETASPEPVAAATAAPVEAPPPAPGGPPATSAPAAAPAPVAGAEPSAAPAPAAPFAPPAGGVYRYVGSGGESVNMPGANRRYPEESFATVRGTGGCGWTFEHVVAEEHVDRRSYCSEPGAVLFHGGETRVTFFGQTDGSRIDCDPPAVVVRADDAPGTTHTARCTGEGTQMDEAVTYVGRADLVIGGVAVSAYHLTMDATISGRAQGTSSSKLWLHPETGLVLRVERQTDTTTNAFGGSVRYQENATFELADLEPRA